MDLYKKLLWIIYGDNMAVIMKLSNIWLEDCFKWMYDLVIRDGGDGSATFVCKNYEEIAELFGNLYNIKAWVKETNYPNKINYRNYLECFTFTDNKYNLDEYVFIIENSCREGSTPIMTSIVAMPVP